jgi:hypothetical protein
LTANCLAVEDHVTTADIRDMPGMIKAFGIGLGTAGQNQ